MKKDLPDLKIALNTFYQLLTSNFPNLKFPGCPKFTKCTTCVTLRDERARALTPERKIEVANALVAHNKQQL